MHANYDRYRLRWRFDFRGKPTRIGQWSRPADRLEDMAAFQNGEGLARASIEAQDTESQEIVTVAECDGSDFCNFQWVTAVWGLSGAHAKIIGLTLMTREQRCTVYVNGKTTVDARTDEDKSYHYATYGR